MHDPRLRGRRGGKRPAGGQRRAAVRVVGVLRSTRAYPSTLGSVVVRVVAAEWRVAVALRVAELREGALQVAVPRVVALQVAALQVAALRVVVVARWPTSSAASTGE
jgi:hypothetical protein